MERYGKIYSWCIASHAKRDLFFLSRGEKRREKFLRVWNFWNPKVLQMPLSKPFFSSSSSSRGSLLPTPHLRYFYRLVKQDIKKKKQSWCKCHKKNKTSRWCWRLDAIWVPRTSTFKWKDTVRVKDFFFFASSFGSSLERGDPFFLVLAEGILRAHGAHAKVWGAFWRLNRVRMVFSRE